jgi:hypothetical protein
MLKRLAKLNWHPFAITKYSQEITENILGAAPHLNKPQVIDTQTR